MLNSQLARHVLDVLQIGIEIFGERRRHADDDHVHLGDRVKIADGPHQTTLDQIAQLLVLDIGDVVFAAVDGGGARRVLVDADDLEADLSLLDGEWQATT